MSITSSVAAGPQLRDAYTAVRKQTERLCEPLEVEDFVVQSMEDVSPAKWHLAHTTWFFETFVLGAQANYEPFDTQFGFLFNSYYNAVGARQPRGQRGLLSRPPVESIFEYRRAIDDRMDELLQGDLSDQLRDVVVLGLHHEQQHQELFVTDIKHVLWCNPLLPAYVDRPSEHVKPQDAEWVGFSRGIREVGHDPLDGFCFDNELPRHEALVQDFELASRPVTNAEFLEFIDDDGYSTPGLWLSEGWDHVQRDNWQAPLYWEKDSDGQWQTFSMSGMHPINHGEPVCHVSFFEADAFARWAGTRLPTEFEWEIATADLPVEGNFVESDRFHPRAVTEVADLQKMFGDVWEWTSSAYLGYPGYRPAAGALGEYNGKFMCNQFVLRGGSCATPQSHIRPTYRNFFQPEKRWQFSGFRLAR